MSLLALLAAAAAVPSHDEQQVMALQRSLVVAADRHDRAALERGIADGFRDIFHVQEDGKARWGETNKSRVIARWTKPAPGGLPTLVTKQRAVALGDAATVFACIVDRSRDSSGREHRDYSRVSDSFARVNGSWKWIASMEVQVGAC